MPYTLKTNQISVKDPETGEYSGVDILAEQTEEGLIAELQAEGTTQVNRINQAAVDVQAAVDQAESDAATIISDTQTSINTLEAQKNTIAQTVASMAELGTDTTFSTPGMAADAGAVGDLSRQLSDIEENQIPELKNALSVVVPVVADESKQLFDYEAANIVTGIYINYANRITVRSNNRHATLVIPLTTDAEKSLTIHRGTTTSKFVVGIASTSTIVGGESLLFASDETANDTVTVVYPTTAQALLINFINKNNGDTDDDIDPFIQSLMVEWGDTFTGYEAYGQLAPKDVAYKEDVNVQYVDEQIIHLGPEIISADGYWDSGWSGDNTNGYTHESGSIGSLTFNLGSVDVDDIFLLEFDTDYTSGEFLTVGIGAAYKVLVYNGTSHIVVPLKSFEGNNKLRFTPYQNLVFTISNISLKRIVETGTEKSLSLKSILTTPNDDNYGFWNVVFGKESMVNAIGSTRSIAIGYQSLNALQGGHRNIGIGTFAASKLIGGECNIVIGSDSMLSATGADNCVAIGFGAMHNGSGLDSNVAIGYRAFYGTDASTAKNNTVAGARAGFYTVGDGNTFVGHEAGFNNTSGSNNIVIGELARGASTGDGNVVIGKGAGYANGVSHAIAIGENATASASNQIVIGDSNITSAVVAGKQIAYQDNITQLSNAIGELNRQLSDVEDNQIPELKSAFTQLDATTTLNFADGATWGQGSWIQGISWDNGSLNGNATRIGTTVDLGTNNLVNIQIYVNDNSYSLEYYAFDSKHNSVGYNATWQKTHNLKFTKGVRYIRIDMRKDDNSQIATSKGAELLIITANNAFDARSALYNGTRTNNIRLNLLSHNIGAFNYGVSNGYSGNNAAEKAQEWRNMVNHFGADIIFVQENTAYFDSAHTISTSSIWEPLYPYYAYEGTTALYIASKFILRNLETYTLTGETAGTTYSRNARKAEILIDGITIAIVDAHLTPGSGSGYESVRESQFNALATALNNYEYVIIGGDFNTDSSSFTTLVKGNGYTPVNNDYITTKTEETGSVCNILLKGLIPCSSEAYSEYACTSDHYPLYSVVRFNQG